MPPKNKTTQQQPLKKTVQRAYYVCHGGTCTCDGAVNPMPVTLNVTSHEKYYILGGTKLIATDKDNAFENLDFQQCKNVPSKQSPQPCKAKIKIKWEKFYKDVTYDGNKHPLLDVSEGSCPGYTGKPGKIKISNHGQTGHATQKEIDGQENELLKKFMQLLPPAEDAMEKKDTPSVKAIVLQPHSAWNIPTALRSGIAKDGSISKILLETPKQDQKLTFTATIDEAKGNTRSVSWNVYGCKANEKAPAFDNVLLSYIEYGTSFTRDVPKNFVGIFRIEAYGFSFQDQKCCIDVEVRPNEVKDIHGPSGKNGVKESFISFESGLLFEANSIGTYKESLGNPFEYLNQNKLNWTITSLTPRQLLFSSKLSINNPVVEIRRNILNQAVLIALFNQDGKYLLTVQNEACNSSKTFEITIEKKLQVMAISHNPENYLRADNTIICKIVSFNIKDLNLKDLRKNSIEWRVYYSREGNNLLHMGVLEDFNERVSVTTTPQRLQALFTNKISSDSKGKYVIEAFGESLTAAGPILQGNKTGAARYYFEVTDNKVVGKPAGPLQVPNGATGTYTIQTLMPVNDRERTAFSWDVKSNSGAKAVIDQSTEHNQQVKIKFEENADYSITCHLTVNGINTGISEELKVHAAPLELKSACWCYDDGYKRKETGYNEECYAYLELAGIASTKCNLQIWALVDDRTQEQVMDIQKHMLQETEVTLMQDKNRKQTTAHGYARFKAEKSKYENLFKELSGTDSPPNVRFVYSVSLISDDAISLDGDITIMNAEYKKVGNKTFHIPLTDDQLFLKLTDKKYIKALFFTNEKHGVQNEITTYGKTHPVKVHTLNMVGEKLTVKVFGEHPDNMLDGTYDHQEKKMVVAEEVKNFEKQTVGESGSLKLDFTLTDDLKDKHMGEPVRTFVAEVYINKTDANGNNAEELAASQYELRDVLPFEMIRNSEGQVGIKILIDKPETDDGALRQYKHQYASIPNALRVVKDATIKDPQPSPTLVTFEDMDAEEGATCPRCRALIDYQQKEQLKALLFISANKVVLDNIVSAFNEMFLKFKIDTCSKKAIFWANVRQESGANFESAQNGEDLNYKVNVLKTKFSYFKDHPDEADKYGMIKNSSGITIQHANPIAIGNRAYKGPRIAGNEDIDSGDGFRYRGRGCLQTTGKKAWNDIQNEIDKRYPEGNIQIIKEDEGKLSEKEAMAMGLADWSYDNMDFDAVNDNESSLFAVLKKLNSGELAQYKNGKDKAPVEARIAYLEKCKILFKTGQCTAKKARTTSTLITGVLAKMKQLADEHHIYQNETGHLRTDDTEAGRAKMDCSEFVSRYIHELGLTERIIYMTTADMISESVFRKKIGNNNIDHIQENLPQPGDIFVWRRSGDGHTGIVYAVNDNEITVLEAIGPSGSVNEQYNNSHGGYSGKGCSRTSIYEKDKGALRGHAGWIGYFRPKNYPNQL